MRRDFGDRVTEIVKNVTEDKSIEDYHKRKQSYLTQLEHDDIESVMLSAADMTHNMLSLAEDLERLGHKGYDFYEDWPDRLWFYSTRAALLQKRLGRGLADDAAAAFGRVEQLVQNYQH
jgi:hypothetical protein